MARIVITLSTNSPLTRIRMSIDVAPPLAVTHSSIIVNSLSKWCKLKEKEFTEALTLGQTDLAQW